MSESTELLEFVYENAKMGEATLPRVIGAVSRPDLRASLSEQLEEYRAIGGRAEDLLRRSGVRPREPGGLRRAAAEAMLEMDLLARGSTRRVAEMMIRGSTMGTIQMSKRIHAYQYTADRQALDLAGRLLETEENNIEQMKAFL